MVDYIHTTNWFLKACSKVKYFVNYSNLFHVMSLC